jgi:hypothetical protein
MASLRLNFSLKGNAYAAILKIVEYGIVAQRQPGLNIGIWIPGRGEFTQAFGIADIATRAPMQADDFCRHCGPSPGRLRQAQARRHARSLD